MAKTKTAPEAETTESCGTCRYLVGVQCHRHAPAPLSFRMLQHALGAAGAADGLYHAWPVTTLNDWCGDYRPRGDR